MDIEQDLQGVPRANLREVFGAVRGESRLHVRALPVAPVRVLLPGQSAVGQLGQQSATHRDELRQPIRRRSASALSL